MYLIGLLLPCASLVPAKRAQANRFAPHACLHGASTARSRATNFAR
jgi:hypothetical protein